MEVQSFTGQEAHGEERVYQQKLAREQMKRHAQRQKETNKLSKEITHGGTFMEHMTRVHALWKEMNQLPLKEQEHRRQQRLEKQQEHRQQQRVEKLAEALTRSPSPQSRSTQNFIERKMN